jgi:hypothetical protein
MLLLILGLGIGIYVGYKYPQQVDQGIDLAKKTINDLKEKFTKKEGS